LPRQSPKILVVGWSNDKSSDPVDAMEPFTANGSGERLYDIVCCTKSIPVEKYLKAFDFVNVAQTGAEKVKEMMQGRTSVVLGTEAWYALKLRRASFWVDCRDGAWLVPHPSGKNRIYNASQAREKTGKLLRRLAGL
jgi:hypothetical protein